ncbi:MAG: hypothetical protein LUI04_00780 [Porphyromonadaceae bacterium]|nr:hypothetical protein [Porphyromonadaceae bacterium]
MAQVRINKYISDTGFCSRREADKLVEASRVTVNGAVAQPGTKVSPGDTVRIDGEQVHPNAASFVEREKPQRHPSRPRGKAPVEEEASLPPSHRGVRGGLRHRIETDERAERRRERYVHRKNAEKNSPKSSRH